MKKAWKPPKISHAGMWILTGARAFMFEVLLAAYFENRPAVLNGSEERLRELLYTG